jgi:O-antigen ligase
MSTDTAEDRPGRGRTAPWVTASAAGWIERLSTAALVFSLGLVPVAVLPADSAVYAGIANPTPTVYVYTVTVAVAVAVLAVRSRRPLLGAIVAWLPLLAWLAALTVSTWDLSPRTASGLLHLGLAALVFAAGAAAQRHDRAAAVLSWSFLAVAWLQLAAIGAAALGHPLRQVTGPQALDVLGRATGLTAHPGELAKVLFFCVLCALALPQRRGAYRWAVWATIVVTLVGVGLAQSRTVLAATISMVGLLVLLGRLGGRWQRGHLVVGGIAVAMGLASVPWLVARFTADPGGGARGHLAAVALDTIAAHPWSGVGPNDYVAVVGATDPVTATGVPVHNVFLLSAAELGIIGALLLWLPFGVVAVRAVRRLWRSRGADPAALAITSALPGVVLIGLTGWGLLQGPYLLIFALVFGYFGARLADRHPGDAGGHPGDADGPAVPPVLPRRSIPRQRTGAEPMAGAEPPARTPAEPPARTADADEPA